MHITRLQIRNFLGLDSVKLDKLGEFVTITGENGVGKSSVLLAIMELFKGSGVKPNLIKTGEKESELLCEIDGTVLVTRTLTDKKNTVTVKVDGTPESKAATYLSNLLGGLGVNPIKFFEAKEADQRAIILAALPVTLEKSLLDDLVSESEVSLPLDGIDFTEHGLTILDGLRKGVYDRRHLVNQSITRLLKSIEQDTADLPPGVEPKRWDDFDLDTALSAMTEAQKQLSGHDARIKQRDELRDQFRALREEEDALTARLEEVRKLKKSNNVNGQALTNAIDTFKAPDLEAKQAEIGEYKNHLKHAATLEGIATKRTDHDTACAESKALDWMHEKLKTEVPQILIEQADIPIDGLQITDEGIFVGDTPLSQLSTAEQIHFAVSLARGLAGDLKVIPIDRWESVVGKLRKLFEKEMKGDGFQYFIAQATPDPELAVDGGTLSTEGE